MEAVAVVDSPFNALTKAAQKGHLDVVELLLAHGAYVNKVLSDGTTALVTACTAGHADIV